VKGPSISVLDFILLSMEVGMHSHLGRDSIGWILAKLTGSEKNCLRYMEMILHLMAYRTSLALVLICKSSMA